MKEEREREEERHDINTERLHGNMFVGGDTCLAPFTVLDKMSVVANLFFLLHLSVSLSLISKASFKRPCYRVCLVCC